jgi:2'-5' RNA ligase
MGTMPDQLGKFLLQYGSSEKTIIKLVKALAEINRDTKNLTLKLSGLTSFDNSEILDNYYDLPDGIKESYRIAQEIQSQFLIVKSKAGDMS